MDYQTIKRNVSLMSSRDKMLLNQNELAQGRIFEINRNLVLNKGTDTNQFLEKVIRINEENEFIKILTNSNNNLFWIKNKSKYLLDQEYTNLRFLDNIGKNIFSKNSFPIQKKLSLRQMLKCFNPKSMYKKQGINLTNLKIIMFKF